MVIDARTVPEHETIEADVCIVGAGTAGITLAREFIGQGFQVCLLESGGMEPDPDTQSLYRGENVGHPYFALDRARARYFGGTSNTWNIDIGNGRRGVRLRPMDEIDFEERDGVPYSGWPFDKSHLDPYYERAQEICRLGPFRYDADAWSHPTVTPPLRFATDRVKTTVFQFGPRDAFVNEYCDEVARADDVDVYLHANVVEIETDDAGRTVTGLRVACLEGREFQVSAKLFILAAGGIETPRLLLLSDRHHRAGLGNQHDLVGRFFMEHLHLWSGFYVPSTLDIFESTRLYQKHVVDGVTVKGKLTLDENVLREENLLNYCVSIRPDTWPTRPSHERRTDEDTPLPGVVYQKIVRKLKRAQYKAKAARGLKVFKLNHMTEQVPNPESRVMLSDERDHLGQRRVQLDWQLSPIDIASIRRAQEILDEELRRAGLGHLFVELPDEDVPPPRPNRIEGGYHHMGTTRMHTDPKRGVVDENCRVHGTANLFVAGPSVFPTVGYANPTLTLVALAVRLADHVNRRMASGVSGGAVSLSRTSERA